MENEQNKEVQIFTERMPEFFRTLAEVSDAGWYGFIIDVEYGCTDPATIARYLRTRGRQFHIWTHYNSGGECQSTSQDHLHVLVRGPHLSTRGEKQKPSQTPFHAFCRGYLAGSNLQRPCVVGQNIWSMDGMLVYLRKGTRKYHCRTDNVIPALQPVCLTKEEKDQIERGFQQIRGNGVREAYHNQNRENPPPKLAGRRGQKVAPNL